MWILLLSPVDRHETLVSRLHLCRTFFFPGFPVDSFFLTPARLSGLIHMSHALLLLTTEFILSFFLERRQEVSFYEIYL